MTHNQSFRASIEDRTLLIIVLGYLCQNALVYWSFSILPEHLPVDSHVFAQTLLSNIYLLPPYLVLLLGEFFIHDIPVRARIQDYALGVVIPGLLFAALAIPYLSREIGHWGTFLGIMGIGFCIQWIVALMGIVHFILLLLKTK